MKNRFWKLALAILAAALFLSVSSSFTCAQEETPPAAPPKPVSTNPRLIVLTDITNEPDDEESLVRLLVYSNQIDIEGLIATTSVWLKEGIQPEKIQKFVQAYGNVRSNLKKHASGFPEGETLLQLIKSGVDGLGMAAVGADKATAGTQHIIEVVDREDTRPVWIALWGGANTLAQTLSDVRRSRSKEETDVFVSKLRVYSIADQDDAGRWLRDEFPELFYIVSPTNPHDGREYYSCTWAGISGDRYYQNGPMTDFEYVNNEWLEKNIIKGHGPLGEIYPPYKYIMEGDSPSFMNLIGNGLNADTDPSFGGWGGRYALHQSLGETRPIWTNSRDTIALPGGQNNTSAQATIWRWRKDFQNDFAARMDWCVSESNKANHNPVAVVNDDDSKAIIRSISTKPGESVSLSAAGSKDPDGDRLTYQWIVYPEASTFSGAKKVEIKDQYARDIRFDIPEASRKDVETGNTTIHVILAVKDAGVPNLHSYRRIILNVISG
jgi:hypothetical protein